MNKRGQVSVGWIVLAVMVVVSCIAIYGAIIDGQANLTDKTTVYNKSVSVVTAYVNDSYVNESISHNIYTQSDWKVSRCPLTGVSILNGANTTLTADTDYVLDAANGNFTLNNTANTYQNASANLTWVSFTSCPDGYNPDSGSRGIARIISLFAAMALLGFLAYGIKEWAGK